MFDQDADINEIDHLIVLVFDTGRGSAGVPSIGPSAYIALGSHACDSDGKAMLTTREMSFDTLKAQVDEIKSLLDARLAEAKARFSVATASKRPFNRIA
jgi:hypothetical protein